MPTISEAPGTHEATASEKLISPLFVFVVIASFGSFCSAQGMNAGSSVYLTLSGYTSAVAGAAGAAFAISAALARIACGPLIDSRGRIRFMTSSAALFLVTCLLQMLELGTAMFFACRIAQGVSVAVLTTTGATMASDILPLSRLGEGIGIYGLGQALAMSIGPALALALVALPDPGYLFLGMAVPAAIALVFSMRCTYERHPESLPARSNYRMTHERECGKPGEEQVSKPTLLERLFVRQALHGALPLLFVAPLFGFVVYFAGLFANEYGIAFGGLFYTLSAVSMIVIRLLSRRFMDRISPFRIFLAAALFGILALALLFVITRAPAGASRTTLYGIAGVSYGLCNGICTPISQVVSVKLSPADRLGAANALTLLAVDMGMGVSSIVWGITDQALGMPATLVICTCSMLVAIALALKMFPKDEDATMITGRI